MSAKRRQHIGILKWFLPLLFIAFINSKILFTHSHQEGSSYIVHSHPFNRGEKTPHNHTAKELIAIELHTNGYSTTTIIPNIIIESPLQYINTHIYINNSKKVFPQNERTFLLRAPPSFA